MAGSPGGKSAGRVSIRVVPDASRFKADLKKSLERIEKSTVLNLPLAIETRQAELDIRKFQKKWNGQQVEVDVDAKTAGAAANLVKFTKRHRDVNVAVKVSKASLAKAGTLIASLSGARVAGDWVKESSEWLQNLDRSLPKLAAITLAVGSISSLAFSSVGGLALMASSLSSLAALAAPIPGLLAAAGVAGVALFVALKDAGTQLKSLNPLWAKLKATIQDNFWAKAKKPILDLVHNIFPALKSGLGDVSTSLGTWAASVVGSFQAAFGGEVLTGLMSKLSQGIANSTKGTDAFAASIAALGAFGAQYLPAIGAWFSDISIKFNGWIQDVTSSGALGGWVSNAMIILGQLGDVVKGVVGTIGGIATAASAAGGGGLKTFADALLSIAAAVNSPAFQGALTTIFVGAAAGAHALASILGPIGSMLQVLAPSLSAGLSGLGVAVSQLISGMAQALSQPGFGQGLEDFIAGLMDGVQGLLPALGPLGFALGTLLQVAGALAGQLGPVLGATLSPLAVVLGDVLTAVQPLIPLLGGALVQAVATLAPLFASIATVALPPLVSMLSSLVPIIAPLITILAGALAPIIQAIGPLFTQLGGVVVQLASALVPLISAILPPLMSLFAALIPVLGPIVQLLGNMLVPIIQLLTPIVALLAGVFAQIAAALAPIIASILPPLLSLFQALMPAVSAILGAFMALITPLLQLIAPLLQLIGPILGPLISLFAVLVGVALKPLIAILGFLTPILGGVASALASVLGPAVKGITQVLGGLITFLTGVFTGNWRKAWAGIVQIFSGIWNGIAGIARGVLNGLVDIINGMIGGVNSITSKVGIPAIPKIPHLATGGDILPTDGGTLIVAGEGGQAETVTNRGETNRLIALANALAARALRGSGDGAGGGNVYVDKIVAPDPNPIVSGRVMAREWTRVMGGSI